MALRFPWPYAPPYWSHYLWPLHVHDWLHLTEKVRFYDIQCLIARKVLWPFLKKRFPLGDCPLVLNHVATAAPHASVIATIAAAATPSAPAAPASASITATSLDYHFPSSVASMAGMCRNAVWVADAREPIDGPPTLPCCNRSCGRASRVCNADMEHTLWNVTLPIVQRASKWR